MNRSVLAFDQHSVTLLAGFWEWVGVWVHLWEVIPGLI